MAALPRASTLFASLLWGLVLFASFYNLSNCPTIWWDEAIFSETAANLAQKGRYAFTLQRPDVINDFDYRISAGPVVIVPVALAYRLFGISVFSGRLVAGLFLVLALALLYLCARRLLPQTPALVAVLLSLLTTDILYWGRSVLGDVPALACFFGGTYCLLRGWQEQRRGLFFGAGLCMGLAVCAKEFYGFTLILALMALAWSERRQLRRLIFNSSLLLLGAALPLGLYLAAKAVVLGGLLPALSHFYFQKKLLCHEFFTPLTIGRLYPESSAYLLSHPLFLSGILGLWLYKRRQGASLAWGYWLANFLAWSLFYVTAVYWHRFALPALLLASPWAGYLLVALVDAACQQASLCRRHRWLPTWGVLLPVAMLFPLAGLYNLQPVLSRCTDSPYKLVEYLRQHVPEHVLIETPEYELIFLDDGHRFHLMPEFYFVESYGDHITLFDPTQCSYDFQRVRAEFLILGSFGKSVFRQNYPQVKIDRCYRKIATIDFYDIYLRRDVSLNSLVKAGPPAKLCPTPQLQ
ncbi:MAG: ArnT family glycosyltransferase [Desulfobacca sp.]|uniref:ArnT family glycosyltransferase n=1 Tax=Desulfobacca sp. TaxID=2067990 RepID=UPI00404988C4